MNKIIMLDLVIKNVIFIQQCFDLPITNPIILGSDFLDTHIAVLDIGDHTITLCCTDYMLTTSLADSPIFTLSHIYSQVSLKSPSKTYSFNLNKHHL